MILFVVAAMGAVILFLAVQLMLLCERQKHELEVACKENKVEEAPPPPPEPTDHNLNLTVKDVLKLANNEYVEYLEKLIREHELETKVPAFYEKYQTASLISKDKYFQNLFEILCTSRKQYVAELFATYQEFSTQDVVLLLMCEAKLDNKTISGILSISMDTLKKRKTRLRMKIELSDKD